MAKEGVTSFLVDSALGGASGIAAKTLTTPLNNVKVLIATQDAHPKIRSGELPRYKSLVDCGVRVCREQGVRRLWAGNFVNCIRYFPTPGFALAFKDAFKKMLPRHDPETEFAKFLGANLASGCLAAACSGFLGVVLPLYASARLASDVGSGKKAFAGLGGVSIFSIAGSRGLRLGCFDTITGLNPWRKDKGVLGVATTFAAAQAAITLGASVTYPWDTVRRRLLMQSYHPVEEHTYAGALDCFKKIAVEEGVANGLYKGFLPASMTLVGALVLVFYDRAKTHLGL